MPSSYDSWLPYGTLESYDSGTGSGGMPVFDTLETFDSISLWDMASGPYDQTDIFDNPNIFFNGNGRGVVPYDAIRVYDGPSPFDWPPQ